MSRHVDNIKSRTKKEAEPVKKKKILVVDNQPMMLKFMKDLLESEGYKVFVAGDGLFAIDILKTYIPDIIFLDLIMPYISGDKLCSIIRSMPGMSDVYIVIISGIAAEHEIDYLELGANACIAKGPFNKMKMHVLSALDESNMRGVKEWPLKIAGLEDVYPREMTKELVSLKRNFEIILGNISEGILEINKDYKIVYANPAAVSLIGVSEELLLASNFLEIFTDDDRRRVSDFIRNRKETFLGINDGLPVMIKEREALLSIFPSSDDEKGEPTIVIIKDTTEWKRMENQLHQAQKMEAIGTLAGGIAHDFNNLLMGIQGNVSLMLLKRELGDLQYERLKGIERQIEMGSKLTAQLLGYARKGKYEIKPTNLNKLLGEIAETFGRTRKEIVVHEELAEDLLPVEVDECQIEQVLLNLFVNASDAMTGGGHLTVKTMNVDSREMRQTQYKPRPGKYVLLTVRDTGTGMDKDTMERIFDPFFTTKEMGRGTGLGLASAFGIIKGHRGYIDVESKKGQGSVFKVYLPISEKITGVLEDNSEKIVKGDGTILLVDDEEMILETGKELLEALGYDVLTAGSGKEAIELYRDKGNKISLIILDMIMPEMGGGKTYDILKGMDKDIRVLLSSGYSIEGQATEILNRGCKGFLQKPFNLNVLSQSIERALGRGNK